MVRGTRAVLGRFKIGSYNLLLKVSETGVNSSFIRKIVFIRVKLFQLSSWL